MRRNEIEQLLSQTFSPLHLEVVDESHMHNVPEGAESHFKVTIVTDEFAGKMLIARHRLINTALKQQLENGIHALALHTMTPDEWFEKGGSAPESPPCLGGSSKEVKL